MQHLSPIAKQFAPLVSAKQLLRDTEYRPTTQDFPAAINASSSATNPSPDPKLAPSLLRRTHTHYITTSNRTFHASTLLTFPVSFRPLNLTTATRIPAPAACARPDYPSTTRGMTIRSQAASRLGRISRCESRVVGK